MKEGPSGQPNAKERKSKHRGHNEGSIYQRKDGRWVGVVTLPSGARKSYYGRNAAEVRDKLLTARKSLADGLPVVTDSRATVGQFLDEWLVGVQNNVRPKTFVTYEGLLRLHAIPQIGGGRLVALTPELLQRLYRERQTSGLSAQTVRHLHTVLFQALKQAVRWGRVGRNVAELVTPPRTERQEMKYLSAEQSDALIQAAQDDRLGALYVLALTTGMRQGELLALRWRDIDLAAGVIHVTGTLQRIAGELTISPPKTRGSRRAVKLSKLAIGQLQAHKIRQNAERLLTGPGWLNRDFVFANEVGGPIEATNLLRRSFKPLLRKAAVPDVRFHDLRHTAATLLLSRGVHPKVVSEMLGHSQVGITLNLYSHVTETMQQQAADAMDGILSPVR